MKKIKYFIGIFIIVLFSECNKNIELTYEDINILYENGIKYCEGKYIVYNKKEKEKIGSWKFYYPNGKLYINSQYNNEGGLLNYKEYYSTGKVYRSQTNTVTTTNYLMFYEDGTIKYESITEIEIEEDSDGEYKTEHETVNEYYKNGEIFSETKLIDDVISKKKVWDIEGNLMAEVEYENDSIKGKTLK